MKLLIITQKIDQNDDILGFFHGWVEEFAKQAEKVVVIAQAVGQYNLPENVEVFSMGKEMGYSKIRQLFNFYQLLFKNLLKTDAVFVHMIPLWVVLGLPIYKIYRKKVYLWYTHKSVNWTLKLAEKFVDKIFTASKESFRLPSKKVIITGHGIDMDKFKIQSEKPKIKEKFKIITAGRIAVVKNYEVLIGAAEILKNKDFSAQGGPASGWEIKIAGAPALEQDQIYFKKLKDIIKEKKLENKINFAGSIPYKNITGFYQRGDLFVNFSDTGSLDKAVLEAMASGLSVLTSNEAFKNILPEKYFTSKNSQEIAGKIMALSGIPADPALRDYVFKNHSLDRLINKIIIFIKNEHSCK